METKDGSEAALLKIGDRRIHIQSPLQEVFDASSLTWEIHLDPHSKYSALKIAHIPWHRMNQFVQGESERSDAPTNFRVQWKKTKAPDSLKRVNNDCFLTQIGFWCCYGPLDYRGQVPKIHSKRRAIKGKHFVGCQCHFVVNQLYLFPEVARISYIQFQHIDGADNICHGKFYEGPLNKLKFAPWLSTQMKEWICSMLHKGFTPQQVFAQHIQSAERGSMLRNTDGTRDVFLTMRDVLNIACTMENASLHTHHDDAISVRNWVIDNPTNVFSYQAMNENKGEAFILGIQTRWQLEMLSKYGHNSLLAMDATFGTNKYKFHLYTILVFDAFRNGVPIAWIITSSCCCSDIAKWLTKLRNRVLDHNKGWEPNAFMVDDAEAEIQALRKVFGIGTPILLCIWHVRRAWLKNLIKKVPDYSRRADMFRQLGLIMNTGGTPCRSSYEKECQAHKLLDTFFVEYASEVSFIDYFKREWLPRIGMWIRASRMMKHANQDTNGSIESYHGLLKRKFLCDKRSIHGRRIDWLIKGLVGSCHSYFWYQEMLKDVGFKQNFRIMDVVKNSLARALEIPDEYVRFHGDDHKHAKVLSLSKKLHFYIVLNADIEWATCTCDWALKGNLCKHQVKVMMLIGVSCWIESSTKSTLSNDLNYNDEDVDFVHDTNTTGKETNHEELIARIQQTMLQSLQVAGIEVPLLEHIHRCAMQMLTSVQQIKASESCMPTHPCGQLQHIEDGFGTSLKRAKPFIEKQSVRRKQICTDGVEDVESFPSRPRNKRVTMQIQLDMRANAEDK
ncbi:hypothetical protein L7F22_008065 [Adiantum nelumboides]|nr:hypothetical protein [Adiantum nelumboides]